jgi:hypothetical protein
MSVTPTINKIQQPALSNNAFLLDDDATKVVPYVPPVPLGKNDNKPVSSDDTPGYPLINGFEILTGKWSFQTYLMYQPTDGNWVPLLEFDWSVTGTATLNAATGQWKMSNETVPLKVIVGGSTTKEPEWTNDQVTWQHAPN